MRLIIQTDLTKSLITKALVGENSVYLPTCLIISYTTDQTNSRRLFQADTEHYYSNIRIRDPRTSSSLSVYSGSSGETL